MASLLELATGIISSHASITPMSSDELLGEIQKVYAALKQLEAAESIIVEVEEPQKPAITVKQSFKKDEVVCMVCGKGKMKALTRHLNMVHNMKRGEYRKQYGIPSKQPLTAKSYSEERKKFALERGLGNVLLKAREARAANLKVKKAAPEKPVKLKATKKMAPIQSAKARKSKGTKIPF